MSNILYLAERLFPGGTETHILSLARSLRSRGHGVGVLTTGGSWTDWFRRRDVKLHLLPSTERIGKHQSRLRHVVASHQYDIVHAHDAYGCRLVQELRNPHVRLVLTVHGTYMNTSDLAGAAENASTVIAVSPEVRWYVVHTCGVQSDKVTIVPNGVSFHRFRPKSGSALRDELGIPTDAFVMGYAGRFTLNKQAVSERVCRILREVSREYGSYVLVAGRHSKEVLGKRASRQFVVCGTVQDMGTFYNACNLVVGTGRVALESVACGVPTLAVGESELTGVLGETNIFQAYASNFGDHGLPKDWGDDALQHEIMQVIAKPRVYQKNALRTRDEARAYFSTESMYARIKKIYSL